MYKFSDLNVCMFSASTTVTLRCTRRLVARVLHFKATVWPQNRPMMLKNSKIFWGSIPHIPLYSCFCIPYCKWLKAGRGLGTRLLANVVCPRCALASAVFWLCHCYTEKKKVCYFDTKMCGKVMSPVLTHLHTCQIFRRVKTTHVLTGQCVG